MINLVGSNGSQDLTGRYLVDMLPQSNLLSVEEHFVTSGQQVLPLVGVADLGPGDILGVAHAPLMCVPLDVLRHDSRARGHFSGPPAATLISVVMASPFAAAVATASPSPAVLECLTPEQPASFLRVWERLPSHLPVVALDLHGPDWTPLTIEQLGDVLCDFPDVFFKSKTDFGSCSLIRLEISFPEGSAPVASRPHRINPIVAEEVDATRNQYIAAGVIQHSISPYSNPLVVIPKKSGGVRITVNYKKFNLISSLSMDQVQDSLSKGGVFPYWTWFLRSIGLSCARIQLLLRRLALLRASMSGSSCPRAAVLRPGGSSGISTRLSRAWNRRRRTSAMWSSSAPARRLTSRRHVRSSIACASKTSSSPPRRLDWAPRMLIFWATPFRPRVGIRTRKSVSTDQNARTPGSKAGPCLDGRCGYYRKFLRDLFKRIRPDHLPPQKGSEFTPAIELSCTKYSPSLPLHQFWSSLPGTL